MMTGFPGFLATDLLKQIVKDQFAEIDHIYLLVLPQEKAKAIGILNTLNIEDSAITLIEGDITKHHLHLLPSLNELLKEIVTHVFHLAAIYDLAVPKNLAWDVNVTGTNNVNEWVQTLHHLERYIYFSTAYVSGKREGKIFESDLSNKFSFRNHYEETKYEAEVLVEQIKDNVPTTIIRPGITKGHSITGKTSKFDGIYFMLNMYERLSFLPFLPLITDGKGAPEGNFVPSDYVLKATSYLAFNQIGKGKTYHLTDPHPYNTKQLQEMICQGYLGKKPKGTLHVDVLKIILSFSSMRQFLRIEKEALDYFTIYSSYDASNAMKDLEGSKITLVDLKETILPMIEFYRKYKDDYNKHIKIL